MRTRKRRGGFLGKRVQWGKNLTFLGDNKILFYYGVKQLISPYVPIYLTQEILWNKGSNQLRKDSLTQRLTD